MKIIIPPAILSILLRGSSTSISNHFASAFVSSSSVIHNNFSSSFLPILTNLRGGSNGSNNNNFQQGSSTSNIHRNNNLHGVVPSSSSSLTMVAEKNRPFNTWTFDKHCESMAWSPSSEISLTASYCTDTSTLDQADLIIVGVFAPAKEKDESNNEEEEDDETIVPPIVFTGKAKELDDSLGGALTELAFENSKSFQNGSNAGKMTSVARIREGGVTRRYILLGLGHETNTKDDAEKEEKSKDAADAAAVAAATALLITKAASSVASACHDQKKATTCHVLLPLSSSLDASTTTLLQTFSTEFYSNLYSDNRYRTGKKVEVKAEDITSVQLFLEGGGIEDSSSSSNTSLLASSITTGAKIAMGVSLTRDIVNAPHNVLNSESLAETARRIAEESIDGCITCEILGKEECEARGMGAYLGVARGSETEPQFIHLTYKPPSGTIKKKVGIVGKGLLFDTGGYNIKTSMMELMKFDCGGAAAVLGAARAIGTTQPDGVEAHFLVAACENMINARAIVPSDILTASNGKTIEIMNTDAEGRLTLADALVFADKECGCESIIELSTLTGACMISLGKKIGGLWTDNDDLAKEIEDVSKITGDKSWRMPMAKEYAESLKSKIADISNLGDRYGGAITAALFLTEFVDKKKPFAHIDIAGPVWDDKSGATGFGAKLVTEWVRRQGE